MNITIDILLLWFMWGFIFIGIGATVFCLVDKQWEAGVDHFFDCFWMGWASSLFFFKYGIFGHR